MRAIKRFIGICLIMMLFLLLPLRGTANSEGFCIHFIDVGQADAAIVLCDGEVLMIDGGNVADSSLIYAYLTKTLGIETIDYMIGTHPHEDHIGGLAAAMSACTVGTVYSPVTDYDSKAFRNFKKYADQQGCGLTIPKAGDAFFLGSATVQFLSPLRQYESINDTSIVVRIVYEQTSFLFTGDVEWTAEHDMMESGYTISSTLLKVAHHGSDTSTSYVFLREAMPQYAVISVGSDNSYGHPTDAVLSRLRDADVTVYRTDTQGNIICYSDGSALTFETEKDVSVAENKSASAPYIGNRNSKKLHYANCTSVADMKEKNKVEFYSRDEAIDMGYEPCKRCNP